jgi:hypothetical protein
MTKIIVGSGMAARLREVKDMELCAESGQTLGRFLSEETYRRLVYQWANAQVTDEDLQRSLQQSGGKTLAEIWARLEAHS